MKKSVLLAGMLALAGIPSCNRNGEISTQNDFDQLALLENLGRNIIIPAYGRLAEESSRLEESLIELADEPTAAQLSKARNQLKRARLAWQACAFYPFGPAETNGLASTLNIYPIDSMRVDNNIRSGEYDLNVAANSDARGFQTLGYLLYGEGETDESIVNSLSETNKSRYIRDVSVIIKTKAKAVSDAWRVSGGNYLEKFINKEALGVSVGSSVGILLNAVIQHYERKIRDGKVGIPVGIRSLGEEIPDRVEAFYAGYSVELLAESINQMKNMYIGGTGVGFDDYVLALESSAASNAGLSSDITKQFDRILSSVAALKDPLSGFIISDKAAVQAVFVEMQALATLLKTDMVSLLGVSITFQDNDGD